MMCENGLAFVRKSASLLANVSFRASTLRCYALLVNILKNDFAKGDAALSNGSFHAQN